MKATCKRSRLPTVAQAVVDMLRSIGAEIIDARVQRRILIIWRLAGRVLSTLIPATAPKGHDLAVFAARECNRVRELCGSPRARFA